MLSDLKQAGWAADTGWVGGAAGSMVCVCVLRAWERGVYETPPGCCIFLSPWTQLIPLLFMDPDLTFIDLVSIATSCDTTRNLWTL